jgi:hypothetical protein
MLNEEEAIGNREESSVVGRWLSASNAAIGNREESSVVGHRSSAGTTDVK